MGNLEALPFELISNIAQFINDEHRPTLSAFCRVNKKCSAAASEYLFTHIKISLDGDRNQWRLWPMSRMLERRQCLSHVQKLEISAIPPRETSTAVLNGLLLPVATFVGKLNCLEHIIWHANFPEIPPCIMDLLRAGQPRLKLDLRHWYWTPCQLPSAGAFPLRITESTSQYLIGLKVQHCWVDRLNVLDDRMKAFMRMVTQLPNLRRLDLYRHSKPLSYQPELSEPELEVARSYLTRRHASSAGPSTIQHLVLDGDHAMEGEDLEYQHENNINRALRKVEFLGTMNKRVLERMSVYMNFPALQEVTVILDENGAVNEMETDWEYAFATGYFFQRLPILSKMDLRGRFSYDTLYNALSHHGPHLSSLILWSRRYRSRRDRVMALGPRQMEDLVSRCPNLEHFTCTVRRDYRASFEEIRIYHALGSLKNLKTAVLTLRPSVASGFDASTIMSFDDVHDDFHNQPLHISPSTSVPFGNVRDAFINTAIDASLVKSIWTAITSQQEHHPLERLRICSQRNDMSLGIVASPVADRIFRYFCSDWFAMRNVRDDSDDLFVKKVWQEDETHLRGNAKIEFSGEMQVFRKIWPSKSPGSDWRDDWSSFTLQQN